MEHFLSEINKPLLYLISLLLSFALSISAIPRIIYISKKKRIFDTPDNNRKIHTDVIPNLGGVAIFLGFVVIGSLFINPSERNTWNYIVAATFILFITGIKDDLINVNPAKKLLAQIAASMIIAVLADFRLDHLHGLFGLYQLPYWASVILTVLGCSFVSNAFNLIDGIDGLAGSIASICTLFFGFTFAVYGNYNAAIICFSLLGAILGFLKFNYNPAKIFMGDSGSLVIGFIISVLAIMLTKQVAVYQEAILFHSPKALLLVALSVLFVPVFDTFRVFITRIMKGRSPFSADRTHLHHYLLDLGFSHHKTVFILSLASILMIAIAIIIQDLPVNICLFVILFCACALFALLYFIRKHKMNAAEGISRKQSKWIL